jgi:glycosyltransferase involved in cell wall biosynthesis
MLGRLSQQGVSTMFGAADVVTLPSYNEGLPNVVCEAMLSGRAVIASTVGGIPEIVEHGRSGVLVAPGDPVGLRAAIAAYAADTAGQDRMEHAARDFAVSNLTWRISALGYDEVLRQAAAAEF